MNRESICAIMKQLRMHPNVIRDFRDSCIINVSEGPRALLYWEKENQQQQIAEIESRAGSTVWHVIKGTYLLGGIDKFEMETYLLFTEEDEDGVFLEEANPGTYYAFAYVYNVNDPELSEYGEIIVKPCNGGLIRVA